MKKYIYLLNALPYFKVLDEYFGQCLPRLAIALEEIELNGESADCDWRITEHVSSPDIIKVFEDYGIVKERDGFRYIDLMWLVCNMYYGENYNAYSKAQIRGVDRAYENIRKSSAKLFLLLNEYDSSRGKLLLERERIKKDWEEKTREFWRNRRTEVRVEKEREWGKEALNGPDWKNVEEEIKKDVDGIINDEMEEQLHELEEWKKIDTAYDKLEHVTLKIGGESVVLDNAAWWFEDLIRNHLFEHFLHDVDTVDQAKALNTKTPGKKPEDNRITAMVYGISQLFHDRGLVATKTNTNLTRFIQSILRLMDLKNNAGKLPTLQQIEKMIENLPNAKTDPKFFSASLRPASVEDLKMSDSVEPENELCWLMSKSRR